MSYKNVTAILSHAKLAINEELANDSDAQHHRLKIEASLNREIEYINLITGIGDVTSDQKVSPGPATTMGGQPIKRPPAKLTSEDLEPNPRKVVELRDRVEALWHTFVTRDSRELLQEVDDTTIRGVAKKAKMKVTKDDPETITLDFIEEIKNNILMEKARIVAADELRANQKAEVTDQDLTGLNGDASDVYDSVADMEKAHDEKKGSVPKMQNPPPPPKKKTNPGK